MSGGLRQDEGVSPSLSPTALWLRLSDGNWGWIGGKRSGREERRAYAANPKESVWCVSAAWPAIPLRLLYSIARLPRGCAPPSFTPSPSTSLSHPVLGNSPQWLPLGCHRCMSRGRKEMRAVGVDPQEARQPSPVWQAASSATARGPSTKQPGPQCARAKNPPFRVCRLADGLPAHCLRPGLVSHRMRHRLDASEVLAPPPPPAPPCLGSRALPVVPVTEVPISRPVSVVHWPGFAAESAS